MEKGVVLCLGMKMVGNDIIYVETAAGQLEFFHTSQFINYSVATSIRY